ncbi:MFS transporter [Pseudomonas chlororaphis]|uniref:MFS transporter n=1 Tax=Pseudomonas chlororaphis TaxID=587753 RepID=UPI000F583DAC|nr:MFS transporter [Pseudomonas chlororaphis]AZC57286.1 Multidrug resistance protein [Pseudomonas chlororaphis subsp. piscium]AZC82201.1 Multidrug resistance protein [Pseudomonas chlororaphis subsp. piscium]AZC95769.1 Multidrug resistance protein [Pseudomonas chlororaphis subsp. piscium]MBP5057156.1 MFS transporter [Pseudomonas chlororaphis]MBP5142996.1 MFS transporter [Pseudomonas chlororaphis]
MATYSLVIRRLMICSLTIVVSRAITSPLLTLFLSEKLSLDQQDVGLLLGIAVFIATLLALYGGYILDRLDKRRLLILTMLSSGIGFVLLTFAHNLYLTTAILVITETASALFLIGSKAIISENLPVSQRSRVFSLRYTLTNIGYATGPMLGVVIAGHLPLAPFLIAGAIALLSTLLMRGIPATPGLPSLSKPQSFLDTLVTLKNDRTLIMFTCGCLLSTIVHGRFTLYLSQYLLVTEDAQSALDTMAALLACNAISVILLQYQIGRFLKREQLRYWIAVGTSLFILGLIGFSLADSLLGWCLAMFVFTLGEMIIYPAEFLFIDTLAPEALRGSYYGAQNLAALGGALSPVICGYLLVHTPAPTMFYALSVLAALGGLLCFISGRRVAQAATVQK